MNHCRRGRLVETRQIIGSAHLDTVTNCGGALGRFTPPRSPSTIRDVGVLSCRRVVTRPDTTVKT